MPSLRLQLPGTLQYRELVTRAISLVGKLATASPEGADVDFTNGLVSAVGEAFNNIAIHALRDVGPSQVTIAVEFDERLVRVELADDGESFDPDSVTVPVLAGLPESGMGLFIIRSCVDRLQYVPGPPNTLILTKFIEAV